MTVKVGDAIPPFRIASVDAEGMKVWAKILHDPNPIHLDPEVVRAAGLGDKVINQGPVNVAYIINALEGAYPGARVEELEVRFLANVFAEDAVEAGGTVTEVTAVDGGQKVSCEVWLKAEGRDLVLSGRAVVFSPHR